MKRMILIRICGAEANTYWYRGQKVAQTKGGSLNVPPEITILENAEPQGEKLHFVNIPEMVRKNAAFYRRICSRNHQKSI